MAAYAKLTGCPFVKEYAVEKCFALKGFIRLYCTGEKHDECV